MAPEMVRLRRSVPAFPMTHRIRLLSNSASRLQLLCHVAQATTRTDGRGRENRHARAR